MILSEKDLTRFWAKVKIGNPDDCWPWLAATTKFGHGVFSVRHKWIGAHRVSFFIKHGYLPDIKQKRLVMHDCENPACQNPKHLLDGTAKENGNYPGVISKLANIPKESRPMFGKFGKANPRYGLKHSVETKQKLSDAAVKRGGWGKCNEIRRAKKLVPRHENLLIFRTPES